MSPDQVRALLPCYVCGDLPPAAMAQVREALRDDPALRAALADLEANADDCRDLQSAAPDTLHWPQDTPRKGPRLGASWLVRLLVVSVLLVGAGAVALRVVFPPLAVHDDPVHVLLHAPVPPGPGAAPVPLESPVQGVVELDQGVVALHGDQLRSLSIPGHMERSGAAETLTRAGQPSLQVFHDQAGFTVVLWRIGDDTLGLASQGDRDALVALAREAAWGL